MKKIIVFALVLIMMICMAVTANAVTPTIKAPNIKVSITKVPEVKISDSFWDKYFREHPITIPAPASDNIGVPEITNAHYTHQKLAYAPSYLQIDWTAVDGAEKYEVVITLANGETITYVETDTSVYDADVACPQSYKGDNGHIAYVKVRAIIGGRNGAWSAEDTISCNALHFGG